MGKIVGLVFKAAAPATEEKFTCPICGKEYKTKDGLDKHIAEKHPAGAAQPE